MPYMQAEMNINENNQYWFNSFTIKLYLTEFCLGALWGHTENWKLPGVQACQRDILSDTVDVEQNSIGRLNVILSR